MPTVITTRRLTIGRTSRGLRTVLEKGETSIEADHWQEICRRYRVGLKPLFEAGVIEVRHEADLSSSDFCPPPEVLSALGEAVSAGDARPVTSLDDAPDIGGTTSPPASGDSPTSLEGISIPKAEPIIRAESDVDLLCRWAGDERVTIRRLVEVRLGELREAHFEAERLRHEGGV